MNRQVKITGLAVLVTVAGCEGGAVGSGNGAVADQPPPPSADPATNPRNDCTLPSFSRTTDVDALPGGIWTGDFVDCASGEPGRFIEAMVSEDGRFRILDRSNHLLSGVLGTTGDVFSGTGLDFAPWGTEYFSGPTTGMFIEGAIEERGTLTGRWGTEWGNYGNFWFNYSQPTYERPTTFADLAGAWPMSVGWLGDFVEGVWTIEPDGRFNGQDDLGCLYSGSFSLIDDRYSIVNVDLTVMSCDLAGSYSGLGYFEDLVDWWDKFISVSVDDGVRALSIGMLL